MPIIVIPARLGSTRLPRKFMLSETGKPLICHTVDRAIESKLAEHIIIASEDQEILDAVYKHTDTQIIGCLTPKCDSGTERVSWTVLKSPYCISDLHDDIIVNLQADEPELSGLYVDDMIRVLQEDPTCDIVTLASPNCSFNDYISDSVVKVVTTHGGYAMYFSRAKIPWFRSESWDDRPPILKHIGVYAFRREFLIALQNMEQTTLGCESLEQLQWLQSGFRIKVLEKDIEAVGIDTKLEYKSFVKRWQSQHPNQ